MKKKNASEKKNTIRRDMDLILEALGTMRDAYESMGFKLQALTHEVERLKQEDKSHTRLCTEIKSGIHQLDELAQQRAALILARIKEVFDRVTSGKEDSAGLKEALGILAQELARK